MAQRAKRHHFVPKWLLKNYCINGKLWVGDKDTGKLEERTPYGTFWERDINTRTDYEQLKDGTYQRRLSDKYEQILGDLDRQAADKLSDLLSWARSRPTGYDHSVPPPVEDQPLWKSVVLAQARRSPESQQRVGLRNDESSTFIDVIYSRAAEIHQPMPPRDEFASDPSIQAVLKELSRNLSAKFSAADDPVTAADGEAYIAAYGLAVGVTSSPAGELVVGSHGLTTVPTRCGSQSWLPLPPDVAVGLWGKPNTLSFGVFDSAFVEKHNLATFSNSKQIVGRSRDLVEALIRG